MKKTLKIAAVIMTTFGVQMAFAMPTSMQKIECAKPRIEEVLAAKGLTLLSDSLDIKKSLSAKSLLHVGIDSAAALGGDSSGRYTSIEYIAFESLNKKTQKLVSGYINITSYGESREGSDCFMTDSSGDVINASIKLGHTFLKN